MWVGVLIVFVCLFLNAVVAIGILKRPNDRSVNCSKFSPVDANQLAWALNRSGAHIVDIRNPNKYAFTHLTSEWNAYLLLHAWTLKTLFFNVGAFIPSPRVPTTVQSVWNSTTTALVCSAANLNIPSLFTTLQRRNDWMERKKYYIILFLKVLALKCVRAWLERMTNLW